MQLVAPGIDRFRGVGLAERAHRVDEDAGRCASAPDPYLMARAAATKALEIDDTVAEAHETIGVIAMVDEWNWETAERALRTAVHLDDPDTFDGPDRRHSSAESRFRRLGRSADGRVRIVAYTLRRSGDADAIRIISARRASRRERAAYASKD